MRTLPQDLEAEQIILGSILINPKIKAKVAKTLAPHDFYRDAHGHIFEAMLSLNGNCEPAMVKDVLDRKGLFEKCGGAEYLFALVEPIVTTAGVDHYCQLVKEMSTRRRIIQAASAMADLAWDRTRELDEITSSAKEALRTIEPDHGQDYRESVELVKTVFNEIELRAREGQKRVGVLCGYECIDSRMQGFEPQTTTYIIGRPSMGKTALACNMAEYMAHHESGTVLFFSLEMSGAAITRRRLAAISGVYLSRIRAGNIEDSQWRDLIEGNEYLFRGALDLVEKSKFRQIENLCSLAESHGVEKKLTAIFVDHIQQCYSQKRFQNRNLELGYISKRLKDLAKDLNVPVIILSQLSRAPENRPEHNRMPQLNDMRDSGELEQDADVVMGVYRATRESHVLEVGCLKGRDVGTWKVDLNFDRYTQRIMEPKEA